MSSRATSMARDFPPPGGATRKIYKFGYIGEEVMIQTFCSSTEARVAIAVHRRNRIGDSMLAVTSTKRSIHEASLRLPLPGVAAFIVLESFGVLGGVVAFVPADFAIVGDPEGAPSVEWDLHGEAGFQLWDDLGLSFLWVHEGQGVMVVHHQGGDALAPQIEGRAVHDVCKAALGVEGDAFSNSSRIASSTVEPAFPSCE